MFYVAISQSSLINSPKDWLTRLLQFFKSQLFSLQAESRGNDRPGRCRTKRWGRRTTAATTTTRSRRRRRPRSGKKFLRPTANEKPSSEASSTDIATLVLRRRHGIYIQQWTLENLVLSWTFIWSSDVFWRWFNLKEIKVELEQENSRLVWLFNSFYFFLARSKVFPLQSKHWSLTERV